MEHYQLEQMNDGSEVVKYNIPGVPLYLREGLLSSWESRSALCHWHEDLELIYVLEGSMCYSISGETVTLGVGDLLLVNSKRFHYGYGEEECRFYCILFHPSLLDPCDTIYQKEVAPFLGPKSLPYVLWTDSALPGAGERIRRIWSHQQTRNPGYMTAILAELMCLWTDALPDLVKDRSLLTRPLERDEERLFRMVSFLQAHFAEPLSLEEIAGAGGIRKSKCCDLFKSRTGETPIDYLNHYRLARSTVLLLESDLPITEISIACGFNSPSYYSKQFQRYYGCSPRIYRKRELRCEKL
ncbi:MAG: AraC family transcriptional regulator [Clostridia bacterium]|nr:AraC family transcriptional regulator [Clostridia bacterium]